MPAKDYTILIPPLYLSESGDDIPTMKRNSVLERSLLNPSGVGFVFMFESMLCVAKLLTVGF